MTVKTDIRPKILVLGIGNLIMSDDGVGVKVVQRLQREYCFTESVEILDGGTLGLDLLPKLEGIDCLIVVDAVETGEIPGTCVRLTGQELPIALETKVSPHQMGLKDLLSVAELLGHAPREMVLIGVQPSSIEMDTELTPEIEVKVEVLLDNILKELIRLGFNPLPLDP
jgi:hydrogenase maturation protease